MPKATKITDFQESVYALLLQVPPGRVTTYAALARALASSPRAVGNALRRNPFAPRVPCHRVIASSGYIGGFKGEYNRAPSGVNQRMKREMLGDEGVVFDADGMLLEPEGEGEEVWFDGPWDLEREKKMVRRIGAGKEVRDGDVD